MRALLLSV